MKAAVKQSGKKEPKPFPLWKHLAVISFFVVIILGLGYLLNDLLPEGLVAEGIRSDVRYDSIAAMEKDLGFPVPDVTELPFPVQEEEFHGYNGKAAEIGYAGDQQVVLLRKERGQTVTWDTTSYKVREERDLDGVTVTLSSMDEQGFMAADWTRDADFIYSLRFGRSYSEETVLAAVRSVLRSEQP